MSDASRLLSKLAQGDACSATELLPHVYHELRNLAEARLAQEAPGQTLQPTALVHEAYLRLVGSGDGARWANVGHFFAAAAEAMRRILIEIARRKRGPQRGGRLTRQDLDPEQAVQLDRTEALLILDEALDRLAAVEPRAAEVVKLRFFAGLTLPKVAEILGVSLRSAESDWTYARAFLAVAVGDDA